MTWRFELETDGEVKQIDVMHTICRIGSDSSMEIQVPGIAPHAVTLREQAGKCIIYNRATEAIRLKNNAIAPGASAEWPRGAELSISPTVRLRFATATRLAVKQIPLAARECSALPGDTNGKLKHVHTSTHSTNEQQLTGERKKLTPKRAAIGLLAVVCLFIAVGNGGNKAANDPTQGIIEELLTLEVQPQTAHYLPLRITIQNARISQVSGREQEAHRYIASIHEHMGKRSYPASSVESRIKQWALNNLRRL